MSGQAAEKKYRFTAPCLMGVEKLLSNELKFMGCENVRAENGRVFFEGGAEVLARANIRSRIAERILLVCTEFTAASFEELFDRVRAFRWSDILPANAAFPVTGSCLSSKLMSVPDCQRIIKKAIADQMSASYGLKGMLPETGALYKIRFLILKDSVTVMIDTSGEPLHKRGYRAASGGAPIKETLAAALCELASVRHYSRVIDPCCGSGTLVIEAAMKALNIAPGINRSFAAESWGIAPAKIWEDERALARELVRHDAEFRGFGSDIDEDVLKIAKENAEKAGVSKYVEFTLRDVRDFELGCERADIICNPPYGERLLDVNDAEELYRAMGERFPAREGLTCTVICPDDDFERCFGRRADKRRKLYNGMISCQVYMYRGENGKKKR